MRPQLALPSAILLLAASGCSSYGGMSMGADALGVTQGGAQDIALARDIIEAGGVPDQSQFQIEGLFSEHDLPLDGEACAEILCPRATVAQVAPVDRETDALLVQLGFATVLTAESFERKPLNLAVVVDVSGSMDGGNLSAVRAALRTMSGQLGPDDRVSLVAFNDRSRLLLSSVVMDEAGTADFEAAIDRLQANGGTNIEAGMLEGYGDIAPHAGAEGVEDRLMLFTDAQPNVGATGIDSFTGMARYYAEAGIGITVFGTGLDLGAELANEVSQTRGGSYHYLADGEAISQVFDDEFDTIVSPVAYDLAVAVNPDSAWVFEEAYGAPLDEGGASVSFGVSTLFLSARSGGIGVILEPSEYTGLEAADTVELGKPVASFTMAYESAADGRMVEAELDVVWDGGAAYAVPHVAADALGVFKMSGLLDEYLAMGMAADACDGLLDAGAARDGVLEAAARLTEQAIEVAEDDAEGAAALDEEAALMEMLAENLVGVPDACR